MNVQLKEAIQTSGALLAASGVLHFGLGIQFLMAVLVVFTIVCIVVRINDHTNALKEIKNAQVKEDPQAGSQAGNEPRN